MLTIKNVNIYGWDAAIRGMRNAKNSWDKSDTRIGCYFGDCCTCDEIRWRDCHGINAGTIVGNNDLALMKKLAISGADHGKFLRMINVTLDIVAPLYWWKEFDTYKVGTVANSCSTMHKIHAKKFEVDDFSCEHLMTSGMDVLMRTIKVLNDCRNAYVNYETWDNNGFSKPPKKDVWWQMIQLLPSSYNQRRTVQLNYQVLKAMYHARRNHKLDEWHTFCDWIETLPYFKEICIQE